MTQNFMNHKINNEEGMAGGRIPEFLEAGSKNTGAEILGKLTASVREEPRE